MARSLQVGYSKNSRIYGKPSDEAEGLTVEYVGGRRVAEVPAYAGEITSQEVTSRVCSATTKAGDPCKARPAEGENLCTFHKE